MYMTGISNFKSQTDALVFLDRAGFDFVEVRDRTTSVFIGRQQPYEACQAVLRPIAPRNGDPYTWEVVFLEEKKRQAGQAEFVG